MLRIQENIQLEIFSINHQQGKHPRLQFLWFKRIVLDLINKTFNNIQGTNIRTKFKIQIRFNEYKLNHKDKVTRLFNQVLGKWRLKRTLTLMRLNSLSLNYHLKLNFNNNNPKFNKAQIIITTMPNSKN